VWIAMAISIAVKPFQGNEMTIGRWFILWLILNGRLSCQIS
jgi:hypothetical protein